MSSANGDANNRKQTRMSNGVVLLAEQNQNIERLYNSVVVSQLSAMAAARQKGDFSFLIFGSEDQDSLETEKTIKLDKIRGVNAGLADKMMNFLKSTESKYKGTDYEFSIRKDKDGNLVVPYIVFPAVADRIVSECSKPEAISLLGLLQESIADKNKEREQKASSTGWVMFFVGFGTSCMTLVGLVVPNMVENLSASLASGLSIMGYVSLGITCVLTAIGVAGKIKKAIHKNELTAQSDTIAASLANAKNMLENIKAKNNEDLKKATENIGKNIAGQALMSLEEQNKKRARQNNSNNIAPKKNIQSANSGQSVDNANVIMSSPISTPAQSMPVASNNIPLYANFNPQQPNMANGFGAINGLFGNGVNVGPVNQPPYAVIGNSMYNGNVADNNIMSNNNQQSQSPTEQKQATENNANVKGKEESGEEKNFKDNLKDKNNKNNAGEESTVVPNEKKPVVQPSNKNQIKKTENRKIEDYLKAVPPSQAEIKKNVLKIDNNEKSRKVADLYNKSDKKINVELPDIAQDKTKTSAMEANI